jgi:hypothetical protein
MASVSTVAIAATLAKNIVMKVGSSACEIKEPMTRL